MDNTTADSKKETDSFIIADAIPDDEGFDIFDCFDCENTSYEKKMMVKT